MLLCYQHANIPCLGLISVLFIGLARLAMRFQAIHACPNVAFSQRYKADMRKMVAESVQ